MTSSNDLQKIINEVGEDFTVRITSNDHSFDYNVAHVSLDAFSKTITISVTPQVQQKMCDSGAEL